MFSEFDKHTQRQLEAVQAAAAPRPELEARILAARDSFEVAALTGTAADIEAARMVLHDAEADLQVSDARARQQAKIDAAAAAFGHTTAKVQAHQRAVDALDALVLGATAVQRTLGLLRRQLEELDGFRRAYQTAATQGSGPSREFIRDYTIVGRSDVDSALMAAGILLHDGPTETLNLALHAASRAASIRPRLAESFDVRIPA